MPTRERTVLQSLFLVSAATLAFEINLTRLFSVSQFYHFAFMIVSIALLGFGASGTALTVFPEFQKGDPSKRLSQLALASGASMGTAFWIINWLPFDSFSIAWDGRQVWILILHYVALAAPFFFTGAAVGLLLSAYPQKAGGTYSANLLGSAAGCTLALAAPSLVGGEGMVSLSMALAGCAGIVAVNRDVGQKQFLYLASLVLSVWSLIDLGMRLGGKSSLLQPELRISPYKGLSYALRYPTAKLVYQKWNSFSRVDVIRSTAVHSLPGLSYRYLLPLPNFDGLLVDGDDLSPIAQQRTDTSYTAFLPNAVALRLRPSASTLILEPRGGFDVQTALALSSGPITAVEVNPLIVKAVPIYDGPRVQVYVESDRSYLSRTQSKFDVVIFSLASSFHPVSSGAYTLAEDYRYTIESFREALARLTPGGLLVATRWIQDPPSEDLRLFALGVTAMELSGYDPRSDMVAFRGFNTTTVLMKNATFTREELLMLRTLLSERAFDLSYAPDVEVDETNLYNILPVSTYYETYHKLINSIPRERFYTEYEYNVRPPTDDHPFFGHYFKWAQAPQVLAAFGKTSQPFGGAGYFVLAALLVLAVLLAVALILTPIAVRGRIVKQGSLRFPLRNLVYFGLLGFAFLFVEIPLLQHFILYLGQPAYAVTTVLFSLLLFSGLGSRWSERIDARVALFALVLLVMAMPVVLSHLFRVSLGLPFPVRFILVVFVLAPLGFAMGIPLPSGIRLMFLLNATESDAEIQLGSIPWIWAVNGAASVIASILSALLVLTFGFNWVLRLGAVCYGIAGITALAQPVAVRHQDL